MFESFWFEYSFTSCRKHLIWFVIGLVKTFHGGFKMQWLSVCCCIDRLQFLNNYDGACHQSNPLVQVISLHFTCLRIFFGIVKFK